MKKHFILYFVLSLVLILTGCSNVVTENETKSNDTTNVDNITIQGIDNTHIYGQLNYVANPFNKKDSVLCLSDIQSIEIKTADYDYYLYLMEVLGKYGDVDNSDSWPQDYHCTCVPHTKVICYIVKDSSLVSIMNTTYTDKISSISYSTNINQGSEYVTLGRTIYPYFRDNNNNNNTDEYYIGDYVTYTWKDDSKERFIYEMSTQTQSMILCFEGQFGPFHSFHIHSNK